MNFGIVFLFHIFGIAAVAIVLICTLKSKVRHGKIKSHYIDFLILVLSSSAILGNLIDSSSLFKNIEKNEACVECYRNFHNVQNNLISYRFYYDTNMKMNWASPIDGIEDMLVPIDTVFNEKNMEKLSVRTYDVKLWREMGKAHLSEDFLYRQGFKIDDFAEDLSESVDRYNLSYDRLMTMIEEDNMENYKILFIVLFPILFSMAIAISIFRIFMFTE